MNTKNHFIKNEFNIYLFCKFAGFVQALTLARFRRRKFERKKLKRILLTNWGALGDIVLTSGVIAQIKAKYPDCQIGYLVSSASKAVLSTCPQVDWVHVVDNWSKLNTNPIKKIFSFLCFTLFKQRKIVQELASYHYDCAIELRPFFPNTISLIWKAKIPWRIGFTSSGNSPLLNDPIDWTADNQYLPHCYWPLLKKIGITQDESASLMPQMVTSPSVQLPKSPYLLFHICSSGRHKELSLEFWQELYQGCLKQGYEVYFTGHGNREFQVIEDIVGQTDYNLCNKLSWIQLVAHIQGCRGLVSVDSVPVHIATAFHTPCAVLFKATEWSQIWTPNISSTVAFRLGEIKIKPLMNVIDQWVRPLR